MAVYTKVSAAAAQEFLQAYDIGSLVELTGIQDGVSNSNYRLQTTAGTFILTLYETRVAARDLPFFIDLMRHLHSNGLSCPLPIIGRNGEALQSLENKTAAIISFLPGQMTTSITTNQTVELGGALAKLHAAGKGFAAVRANALGQQSWAGLADNCKDRADLIYSGLASILAQEVDYLQAHWPQGLPCGVIHADLFPDNVLFEGDKLCGMIDFYFACTDYLAYDLAICLNAWCFDTPPVLNLEKTNALVKSYQAQRKLGEAELKALPILARGASLRFLLTRLYDFLHQIPGALVKPLDPLAYLQRLQFHRQATGLQDYGIDL